MYRMEFKNEQINLKLGRLYLIFQPTMVKIDRTFYVSANISVAKKDWDKISIRKTFGSFYRKTKKNQFGCCGREIQASKMESLAKFRVKNSYDVVKFATDCSYRI